ncbi:pilus assembly protein TadG-related protein [Microbacterium testaceum]|uniref:pilus assembly protein TadG-related protein n=1 Tax=Microbacterium testaceum TaxID=2033 RepID=UPI002AC54150|nr:pilus assembly protein TadG-related protein [Microbacterium testaceum]MDZ5146339.1 hypothetical protein [Microbacterium testaceum]
MKFLPWYAGGIVVMLLLAGLVVDGGGKTQTLQQAMTIAQSAARAGTNAAAGNSINGDAFNISTQTAVAAAENYLAAAGVEGTATVAGDTVTVTVTMTYHPRILAIVDLPVRATGSAQLIGN